LLRQRPGHGALAGAEALPLRATVWQGHPAMRISVSSWASTDEDVERSLAAMMAVARECSQQ
jgi:hypothetical protein